MIPKANKKLKLVQIKHNLYYVAKIYDELIFFPKSDDLPYDEAVKKLEKAVEVKNNRKGDK